MSAPTTSFIPQIHLLCMEEHFSEAFEDARKTFRLPSSVPIQIHNYRLSALPSSVRFDTIVSPANSYGRLDGAFDDAISRALSPKDDYLALTHVVQRTLYEQCRGFAAPGTCTLVRIPDGFQERSRNVWGTSRIALCPTMRMPADVRWDREVIYECIWNLLCSIDNHNRNVGEGKAAAGEEEIRNVLMTPLATGVGRVSAERWAAQTVLAMKHFVEASELPDKWRALEWHEFGKHCAEVQLTWTR
ncbi:Fc.00g055210.m01.CDS01 [Cosmosporella sp. VM-42]